MLKRLAAMVVALFLAASPATAEPPATEIQAVIEGQLAAFQRNDLAEAFSYASPGIRAKFRDAENFGRMVQQGYPMVWRPVRHEMLQLVETSSGPVQVVLFEDQRGRMHEAGYLMEEIDGVWRISGVRLREQPGVGT